MENFMKIAELNPSSRSVNTKVHVIRKDPEREVVSRKDGSTYRVAEALVGDSSGCILMTLWNEDIDLVHEGENYEIINGYVSVFRGSMRLNSGRNGQLEKIDEEVQPNQQNNLSEKRVQSQFRPRRDFTGKKGYGKRRY